MLCTGKTKKNAKNKWMLRTPKFWQRPAARLADAEKCENFSKTA